MSNTRQMSAEQMATERANQAWQKMRAEKPFSIDELYRMIQTYNTRMPWHYQCGDMQDMYYVCALNSLANKELATLRAQLEVAHVPS